VTTSAELQQPSGAQASPGYDRHEPNIRFIGWLATGIVLGLLLVVLGIEAYFSRVWEQEVYVRVLQPEPEALKELRAREQRELYSYGFLDREKGLVRLPVERAMELLIVEAGQGRLFYPTQPKPVAAETQPEAGSAATSGGNLR